MNQPLRSISRQQLAFYTCCMMPGAMIYSKFLLSVGMIGLLLNTFFTIKKTGLRLGLNPELPSNFKLLFSKKSFLAVTFFFLLILASAFYSEDIHYTLERLRIKLPFLLLPLAFLSFPAFSQRQYYSIFYSLLVVASFSALLVGINYSLDYEAITESMLRGQAIPTPTNHIRYSLLLALSILSGAVLWWNNFYLKYRWERHLILGLSLFLILMIHILSVRSGLLVLYISAALLSLRFIFLSKRFWLGLTMIIALIITPIIAYQSIPSLQAKVAYVRYDFEQYRSGNMESLSDAERFVSMAAGLEIGKKHLLFGVGAGDLKKEVKNFYEKNYPDLEKPKMPHNQFISVFTGTGLLGLLLFTIAFFYPLYDQKNYKNDLFLVLHIIVFFSFFIENTIESAVGVAFYLIFLLVGLNHLNGKK